MHPPKPLHPVLNHHKLTNLTAVLTGAKSLVLEERPVPTPKDGEILIKVMSTGM